MELNYNSGKGHHIETIIAVKFCAEKIIEA